MKKPLVLLVLLFGASAFADVPCESLFPGSRQVQHLRQLQQIRELRQTREGIFFRDSGLTLGAIPFDQIQVRDIRAALNRGLSMAKARFAVLKARRESPTFENTILAIEALDEPLDRVENVLFTYLSVNTSPALERVHDLVQDKLLRFSNEIIADRDLFNRVKALHDSLEGLGLNVEQRTHVENTYRRFIRGGVALEAGDKARLIEIDQKLSSLGEKFKRNVMEAVNSFELVVTNVAELAGIPVRACAAAAKTAKERQKEGAWIFTLQPSSLNAVLTYADSPELRRRIWEANGARAMSEKNDNRPILREIARLRAERAKMLGYRSHADYVIEERMARSPVTVMSFLNNLADVYRDAAVRELAELEVFAGRKLNPWDVAYYSAKLGGERFGFDAEELRPYFPLEQVVEGAFLAATKRYGVTFHPRPDLPTWDTSVVAYEVRDAAMPEGGSLALFYLDPFPRKTKAQGAWNFAFQGAGMFAGRYREAHVLNAANLVAPTEGKPALLSPSEVTTVFHELGHALHAFLSRVGIRSLAGTKVPRDFVELPSQLNENWAMVPELLMAYARHYETGEPLPTHLIEKLKQAENFQAGMKGLRQVSLGMLDLAWHQLDLEQAMRIEDVDAFERSAMQRYRLFEETWGALMSPAFLHIFSGGYSAGYYSYKWADVLAADAFTVFEEAGVFDPATSQRFLREVLEKGASEEPMTLYRRFKGGDPDPNALLRKEGLAPPSNPR